jgi:CHASE2 domain-containing sensor protein
MRRFLWRFKQPGALRIAALIAVCAALFMSGWFSAERTVVNGVDTLLSSDRIMRYATLLRDTVPGLPVTVIAIDDATYDAWGEPLLTPKSRLKELIEVAARAKPTAIVVDIDLRYKDPDEVGAAALLQFLTSYDGPPLVIARASSPISAGLEAGDGSGLVRLTKTPFDAAIAGNPRLFMATTLFEVDRDFVIRRWRLWETDCTSTPKQSIPSVQLLVAAIAIKGADKARALERDLAGAATGACDLKGKARRLAGLPAIRKALDHNVASDRAGRITYSYKPNAKQSQSFGSMVRTPDGRTHVLAKVASAQSVIGKELDGSLFMDRVVLIGATHRDSGDVHRTPLEAMAGVFILANAISATGAILDKTVVVDTWATVLAVGLFVVFSLFFLAMRNFVSLLVCLAIAIVFVVACEAFFGVMNGFDILADALAMFIIFQLLRYVFVGLVDDMMGVRWLALFRGGSAGGSLPSAPPKKN